MESKQNIIKLNLGCSGDLRKGYVNLNKRDLDLNKIPYPYKDNSIDEIILRGVLHFVEKPVDVIIECHRILKEGGKLYVLVPHYENGLYDKPLEISYFHEKWFTYFDDKIKKQGMKVPQFDVKVKVSKSMNPLKLWWKFRFRKWMIEAFMYKRREMRNKI